MTGETRILGSFIGIDLSSVNEVSAAIDSTRYVVVAGYVTNISPAITATEVGIHAEIWTGPGATGTKVAQSIGFPANPTPSATEDIRQIAPGVNLLAAPNQGGSFGHVLTADTLYWRTTAAKGTGITCDVHIVGFDLP